MANFLAGLLSSGDYSDLTLVCEDQEFRVHKNIEAKTNTFHVAEFDLTTVKCMLDYMYTGKYEQMPPGCCDKDKDQAQTTENGKNDSVKNNNETWIYHGPVNCIADCFDLPELAKMATATLERLTQEDWSEDAFCDLLHRTHSRTGDIGYRDMLATRAADRISELIERGLFNELSALSDDMTPAILRICVGRLDALRSCLKAEIARADKHAKNLQSITSFAFRWSEKDCEVSRRKSDYLRTEIDV
ncbi:hypothetical protein F4801DRAFT_584573 [Xylaria longipes]|nr:hypothetical protein F4801DRAFT_584573 [Xylaria longipes]